MRFPPYTAPFLTGLALALVVILLPTPGHLPERDTSRDIVDLQQAECEYRGITSSFEELTRVYVLQTYEESELLRWEARPSPQNPETETLVTGIFTVTSPKPSDRELPPQIAAIRRQAAPSIGITWRYSTLAAVRITAFNEYAVDALAVFRQTIDDFIAKMVVVTSPTALRQGPGADFPFVEEVKAETVLLQQPEPGQEDSSWLYVRVPSSSVEGWIKKDNLKPLENVQR